MKAKRKKYAGGTSIKSYLETPRQALTQNQIDIAKAQYEAASNPVTMAMQTAGNIAMSYGTSAGGFNALKSDGTKSINMSDGTGNFLNELLPLLGNLPLAAMGGTMSQVPVEVEGQEVIQTPEGVTQQLQGPSHENGGMPMVLPEGTDVYSKRIKVGGKTMAQRKMDREKKDMTLDSLLNKNRDDKFIKNTVNRTKKALEQQEASDMELQKNIGKLIESSLKDFGGMQKMSLGGPVSPEEWLKQYNPTITTSSPLWKSKYKQQYDIYAGRNFDVPEMLKTEIPSLGIPKEKPNPKADLVGYTPESQGFQMLDINDPSTLGDKIGLVGNAIQGISPLLRTLKNRAEDTPNINPYENFGENSLNTLDLSKGMVDQITANNIRDINLSRNSSIVSSRNSARGVNTKRALDLGIDQQTNNALDKAYANNTIQKLGINSEIARTQLQQDSAKAQGLAMQDSNDRLDKDNFDTNISQNLVDLGFNINTLGKNLNQIKYKKETLDAIDQITKMGIADNEKKVLITNILMAQGIKMSE
jgi:hypothetical protein